MRRLLYVVLLLMAVVASGSVPAELYRRAASMERDSLAPAVELYRQAADSGYAPAQNYLGFLYFQGHGVSQNTDSALYYISLAADADYPQACNNMAWLWISGPGMKHDVRKGAYWLQRASDLGHAPSMLQLAQLLLRDTVLCDTVRIRSLAFAAAGKGLPEAGNLLWRIDSAMYAEMPVDSLFRYAAEYYHRGAAIPAMKLLHRLPEHPGAVLLRADAASRGYGVPYDYENAMTLFYKAACMGEPSAQFIVAEMLEVFPDAFPQDTIGAGRWYERAAEQGITDARMAARRIHNL